MKFLLLLTALLTVVSCGEKAWEGCAGAEYTASAEETENIFKAESSSYDGFHCPVMEEAWPGTDSKEFVDYFIGSYTAQKAFIDDYGHEEIPLDDALFDEEPNLWRAFTIESLVSCKVGVADSGDDCADIFLLQFKSDKVPFEFDLTSAQNYKHFYRGFVDKEGTYCSLSREDISFLPEDSRDSGFNFVISFEVKNRDYERIMLLYSKD